jgi:hypothetical protein
MRVSNPDCSLGGIHGPLASTAFLEIVSDYFPGLHAHKEQCSVWILPKLVAPETDLNLAHVVGDSHANRAKP